MKSGFSLMPATQPVWFKTTLEAAGAIVSEGADLVALPRAIKNHVEQNGARAALTGEVHVPNQRAAVVHHHAAVG